MIDLAPLGCDDLIIRRRVTIGFGLGNCGRHPARDKENSRKTETTNGVAEGRVHENRLA